jgi:Tfp pilus assembly protein PilF
LLATLDQPGTFRPALEDSLNAYEAGDYAGAETKLQPILEAFPSDPSALYVKAMAEYRKGNLAQAGEWMDASERTQPMSAFRCWSALQLGLATGSRARIDRECKHLADHPQYADQVRRIRKAVERRGV